MAAKSTSSSQGENISLVGLAVCLVFTNALFVWSVMHYTAVLG